MRQRPSRRQAPMAQPSTSGRASQGGSSGVAAMPVTVWSPFRLRPSQLAPEASRPGATRRRSGSTGSAPLPSQCTPPPVAVWTPASRAGSARRSAISSGLVAAAAAKALRLPSLTCQTPGCSASRCATAEADLLPRVDATRSALATDKERAAFSELLKDSPNQPEALEDVFWAVLNSREFVFNH